MKLLGLNPVLAADQRLICVGMSAVIGTCGEGASQLQPRVRIRCNWYHRMERGCRHDTLCCGFIRKKVFVMNKSCSVHNSSSRYRFSFMLAIPNRPRHRGQDAWRRIVH